MNGANGNAAEDPQGKQVIEIDADNGDGQDNEGDPENAGEDINLTDVGDPTDLRNAVEEEYEGKS